MKTLPNYLSAILFLTIFGCNSPVQQEKEMEVSIRYGSCNNVVYYGYTEDHDSLWSNKEWLVKMRNEMKLTFGYKEIILFDSKEHIPAIEDDITTFSQEYDKYVICNYYRFTFDSVLFCYGKLDENREFEFCEQ